MTHTQTQSERMLGVDNILIDVLDLDEAVAYYRDGLGLPLKFRMDARGIALFSIGNETVGLLVRVVPQTSSGGMRVWLEVADARAAATVLSGRGLSPLRDPFETATGWTVEVSDPWGNVVGLTDYTLRPELGRSGRETS